MWGGVQNTALAALGEKGHKKVSFSKLMSIINFHSYQPLVKAIADEDAEEVAKQAGQLKEQEMIIKLKRRTLVANLSKAATTAVGRSQPEEGR